MNNPLASAFERGKALGDQLRALEERAGIAAKIEDARFGPLFPNLEASADQYFMETEDYARTKTRDLYFGISDEHLRKLLIAKKRECDEFHHSTLQEGVTRAQQTLARAQHHSNSLPWLWAGCLAALAVAVGAKYFQLYGALAGALLGFFIGQGVIASAKTDRAEELREAKQSLAEETETVQSAGLQPDWFNAHEQITGERDNSFDNESVMANFYARKREAHS